MIQLPFLRGHLSCFCMGTVRPFTISPLVFQSHSQLQTWSIWPGRTSPSPWRQWLAQGSQSAQSVNPECFVWMTWKVIPLSLSTCAKVQRLETQAQKGGPEASGGMLGGPEMLPEWRGEKSHPGGSVRTLHPAVSEANICPWTSQL